MDDIRKLDLNLLRVFDAVMRRRNVSRAAADLGLTQSSISNALNRLRATLDDPLFLRESRGVTPTAFAEELAPFVEQALSALREGLETTRRFDPATASRQFNVIMTDIAEAVIMPRVLTRFGADAPGLSLRAISLPVDRTADALASGDADLAVGFLPELPGPFYQRFLFETDYVCIVAPDNPLAKGRFDLKKFLAARHAVPEAQGTGHIVVQQAIEAHGIERRIGARVPHFLSLPFLVASSDLVAIVPRALGFVTGWAPPLKILKPPIELPTVAVRLLWHERFNRDPANRWLRELLVDVFAGVEWD